MTQYSIKVDPSVEIGPLSIVGAYDGSTVAGFIEAKVQIGSYCHIANSAKISRSALIDHYCRIGRATVIGERTRILYNAQIYAEVSIGSDCVVSGEVPDRVVIEDRVTYMGRIAHTYNDPTLAWDSVKEPSPIIRTRSVVGVGALIIGPVTIGPRSYVAAGEVVRHDVPADSVLYRGSLSNIHDWRGLLKVRE